MRKTSAGPAACADISSDSPDLLNRLPHVRTGARHMSGENPDSNLTCDPSTPSDQTPKSPPEEIEFANIALLQKTFETMKNAVVLIDLVKQVFRTCNPAFEQMFGYQKEEIVGKPIEILHLDVPSCKAFTKMAKKRLSGYKTPCMEFPLKRKDGSDFLAEISFTPLIGESSWKTGLVMIISDITDRGLIEEIEEAYNRGFKEFFDNSTQAAFVLPVINGANPNHFSESNSLGYKLLGYEKHELISMGFQDIVSPECAEEFARTWKVMADQNRGVFETVLVAKSGEHIPVKICASHILEARGTRDMLAVVVDFREDKKKEAKIIRQAAQAKTLVNIAADLNAHLNFERVLELVCDHTVQSLGMSVASVILYDQSHDVLRYAAFRGKVPTGLNEAIHPVSSSVFGKELYDPNSAVVIPDIRNSKQLPNAPLYAEHDVRTVIWASLMCEGQLIGVLTAAMIGTNREFAEDELHLLRGIANQAAQAISNTRLFHGSNRRLRFLQALRDIDKAITGSLDLDVILSVLLNQVTSQLNADAADVLLCNPYSPSLEYASGHGFETRALQNTKLRMGDGFAGRAAQRRKTVLITDLTKEENQLIQSPLFAREGFVTYYAVPLVAKGQVKGVLEVFFRKPFEHDDEWLEFLDALAGQAAIAIDNVSLFEAQQIAHSELILAYDATLEGWSRALDLRDTDTEGHSARVTETALILAKSMGIKSEELVHIRRGALLHDIGKVGIPDSILLKPGVLTEKEFQIMRDHPTSAHDLLQRIPFLQPALDIPFCHHERWDGTGYPQGLKGEDIPLAARIFSVVDVWDALCSNRPYRKAWSRKDARDYIEERSGTQFDPQVVKAFLRMIDNELAD